MVNLSKWCCRFWAIMAGAVRQSSVGVLLIALITALLPVSAPMDAHATQIYTIQTGAYRHLSTAAEAVDALKAQGLDAFYRYEASTEKGHGYYRVFHGKYPSKGEAEQAIEKLKELNGMSDAFVRRLAGVQKVDAGDPVSDSNRLQRSLNPLKSASKELQSVHGKLPIITAKRQKQDFDEMPTPARNIAFKVEKGKSESIFVHLDRNVLPLVNFPLKSEKPELTIRLKGLDEWEGPAEIPIGGEWIRRIRTRFDPIERTAVILLELNVSGKYDFIQDFNPVDNRLTLTTTAVKDVATANNGDD